MSVNLSFSTRLRQFRVSPRRNIIQLLVPCQSTKLRRHHGKVRCQLCKLASALSCAMLHVRLKSQLTSELSTTPRGQGSKGSFWTLRHPCRVKQMQFSLKHGIAQTVKKPPTSSPRQTSSSSQASNHVDRCGPFTRDPDVGSVLTHKDKQTKLRPKNFFVRCNHP